MLNIQMKRLFITSLFMLMTISSSALAAGIEINDERATVEYWISRNVSGDKILMTDKQINQLNAQMIVKDKYASNLLIYPKNISAEDVKLKIKTLWNDESNKSIDGLYISQTQKVTISDFNQAKNNRNLEKLTGNIKTRYAVTVERSDIRLLPESQAWYDDPNMLKYDMLQGTAIDPAEAVAVLNDSADGKFVFVQSKNYFGWIEKSKLAFTNRQTWLKYVKPEKFLVVIDNKKSIKVAGKDILFQMGAVIPLNNQNNVILPTSINGKLKEINVPIKIDDTVNYGFLPCNENNFIRQAFKFLGDEYGWGGMDESVDCSSFVEDVYKSMGIEIPRDTNRQKDVIPIWTVFNDMDTAERFDIIKRAPIGSLLFKPGHVMMKLGNDDNGNPIVIHSVSSYFTFNGENKEKHYIRKVLISDLNFMNGKRVKTIDGLTAISYIENEKN